MRQLLSRLLISLGSTLLLSAPALADEPVWQPVSSPGLFQVELPGEPQPPADGTWESYSEEPLQAFTLQVTERPRGSQSAESEDPLLIAAMNGRIEAIPGGRLLRARRILSERLPGCRFDVETDDSRWDFMILLHGDRMYTLSVSSMKDDPEPARVERFFSSFQVP